ncbi:MAG TPA: hypothetical protein VN282_15190 [Pyrinomonadaceae bacterium]|nr:hypothetical protein [Pyrinomonadaceae bacterium]
MKNRAVGEQVTVVADAPVINAESGAASTTITERQIQDVPLNNRSVLDLAVTAPGVTGDAGSEDVAVGSDQPVPGFNLSVGGGRPGSTAILADGVNNTGVGIARSVVSFTPETVQEFTVQTSAYSAEYGQTGGGTINITTKSGTNDFNGVALWYHRNPKFNASQFSTSTATRPVNNLRFNQVSVTAGGPVYIPKVYDGRNKTFFFFAYEPRWRRDFSTGTSLLPTLAERTGDFRGLVRTDSGIVPRAVAERFGASSTGNVNIYQQFVPVEGQLYPIVLAAGNQYCQFNDSRRLLVNQTIVVNGAPRTVQTPQCNAAINANPIDALNVIPQEFLDPTGLKIASLLDPPDDYFLDGGIIQNFFGQGVVNQDETRYTLKFDHNFTDRFKASFRYTTTPAVGIRGRKEYSQGGVYSDARQYLATFNNIFTSNLINDLRINYTRGNFSEDYAPAYSIKGTNSFARDELGLPSLTSGGGAPLFLLTQDGDTYEGADIGFGGSTNNFNIEDRFNINDIVYWTRGNQTWKFGVDLSQARLNVTPFFAASGGRWSFRVLNTSNNRSTGANNGGNPYASLLIGVPNAVDVRPQLLDYNYYWKSGAAFVQNDWKVRPNFTLNFGMRYTLQYPRAERNNLQAVFRPDLARTVTLTAQQRQQIATGLALPLTDPYIPTEARVTPLALAGQGGRSKYLTPVDYWGLEPRLGFAWQPKMKLFGIDTERRQLVIRGGYGISHAPLTGSNRNPTPDFGGFTTVSTVLTTNVTAACPVTPCASTGTANIFSPIRLSSNPPLNGNPSPLATILGADENGLVFNTQAGGFAVSQDSGNVPYAQTWNLTAQFEAFAGIAVELSYTGNKGTHLYMPQVNINPRDLDFIEYLEAQGIDSTGTFTDPLGRRNTLGSVITINRASVATPFFGLDALNTRFDPSANSIRHAGWVDVRRRVGRGLTFTANYTYAKSIDDASDASPDARVLNYGSTRGHVTHGAPRSADRELSTYDVKHNFSSTFVWDLPVGRRGGSRYWLLGDAPDVVNAVLGGWTLSGVFRMPGGTPFLPFLTDANKLGSDSFNRTVRLDIVEGVPLKNPLWDRNCPTGTNPQTGRPCEPFINPAAFKRPAKGSLGSAPRTLDVRTPRQELLDLSLSKDFPWPFWSNEKRRINFRVDAINVLNHPNFRYFNTGNTPPGFGTAPIELTTETVNGVTQPITAAEYNAWAAANGRPLSTTAEGAALLQQVRGNVNATRLPPRPGSTSGALPLDFFSVRIPQGFATATPESFDITTLEGFKLYRLRQRYDSNFGTLTGNFSGQNPRYVQFGIRIFF